MQWWTTETIFSMIFKLSNHFQPIPINNRRRGSQDNLEAFLLLTTNPHTVQKQPASNYHQRGHHQTKSLTSPQGNNHKRTAKTPYGYIIMKVPAHRLKNTTKELVPEYIEILEFDPEEIPLQTSRHRAWRWLWTEDLRKLAKEKSRLWPYEGYEPILTSERVDALKKMELLPQIRNEPQHAWEIYTDMLPSTRAYCYVESPWHLKIHVKC